MDKIAAVRHDSTALYAFVDSVAIRCATGQHLSYPEASQTFFDFVVKLADATKLHLAKLTKRLDVQLLHSDPDDFDSQAREIATLRYAWYWFHQFVKPALDAHTLESPFSLVEALAARLRLVPGFENVRFAILHTRELNYFQLQSNAIREKADLLQSIVDNAPIFPPDLALVAIPYSQASSVFLNILLAHEMGHFAFQRLEEGSKLQNDLARVYAEKPVQNFTAQDFAQCTGLILSWLEEVYCDLFALYLAGPAFCFAFIDLLSLIRVEPSRQFEFSHPAHSLRLREQARMLQENTVGWWQVLSTWKNGYTSLLRDSLAADDRQFSCRVSSVNNVTEIALDCFLQLVDRPRHAVLKLFSGLDSGATAFEVQREDIDQYLSAGVVPSRLVRGSTAYAPTTVSLVNACYLFYSDKLDTLLNRLSIAEAECLECRASWAKRLEMWLAKALEDVNPNGYSVTRITQKATLSSDI